MGADLGKAKTGKAIGPAEVRATREQLAACEARIETGLKSFADVGAALAEIRDSKLYMITHKTFEGYCQERWELRGKRPYEISAAAAVAWEISHKNMPPPAIESHAAALVKVPEDRRAEVWAKVREQTGGRPTARAVAETWQVMKDPHADLRRKPQQIAPKPPVPAGDDTNARNRHRDSSPGKADRPANAVAGDVKDGTTGAESASTTAGPSAGQQESKQEHVCDYAYICRECGKPDRVFGTDFDKLMRERRKLEDARDALQARVRELEDGNEELRAKLSAALSGAEQAAPPTAPRKRPEAADSAHGNGQVPLDADGNVIPDYDDDLLWMEPDYEASQVPARGRRR